MQITFLWTDICFLTLIAFGIFFVIRSFFKPQLRRSLLLIGQSPIAVSAGVFLLFFLCLGLLDSIHVRFNTESMQQDTTLLDRALAPLGDTYEKTYSAPFALKAYVSETIMQGGKFKQILPRLKYPPATIKTPSQRNSVVAKKLIFALALGICLFVLQALCVTVAQSLVAHQLRLSISMPRLSLMLTVSVLVALIWGCYDLSRLFHIFGTGQIGQDIFFYSIKSIRTGLVIGLLTTVVMMPLALLLGVMAGYFGGFMDDVVQYIYTTLSSIPGVLLITAAVLSLQIFISNHPDQFPTLAQSADARLLALCFILGVTSWTSLCRLLRAETLKLRESDFVLASKALGCSWFTVIRKHIFPNVLHIVLITLVLDFSYLVLAEAVLSYVGVGVSPMTMSFGNMINSARLELARDPVVWWPILAAFTLMLLLVLSANLFADVVRDAFDPRHPE